MTRKNHRNQVGKILGRASLGACLLAGLLAAPATGSELIPVGNDELLIAEPGTVTQVVEVQVDPTNVGRLCKLTVVSENQASVHHGNNLIVLTGDQRAVIEDVEAEPDATVDLSVELTVGETIAFELEMGPDWVSSLGFSLSLDCDQPAPPAQPSTTADVPEQCTETPADPDPAAAPTVDAGTPCAASDAPPPLVPVPQAGPVEVPFELPIAEAPPCTEDGTAKVTSVPTDCPTPPVVDPQPESESNPQPEVAPQLDPTPSPPAAEVSPEPEVLGLKVERLPTAPAATAIPANPTYNG